MSVEKTSVLVTGSLAFDHIMSMPGRFRDHLLPNKLHILNVSFLMDTLRKEWGGTGGNLAYTLALLGIKPTLVAAAGKDFVAYRKHLQAANVNLAGVKVFPNTLTGLGFVVADRDDNQIWGFYGGAMRQAGSLSLKPFFKDKPFVVISPNDPVAMMRYVRECRSSGVEYLFDPAFYIPRIPVRSLAAGIRGARVVIGNDYEIALMLKRTKLAKRHILRDRRILVTTLGKKGSLVETGGAKYRIPPAKPRNTSDPTGAGDAYRAGFLAGFLRDFPLKTCGRMGSCAAAYTVELYGTQTHRFTKASFALRYKKNFSETIRL